MTDSALDVDELSHRLFRVWKRTGPRDFPWAQEDRVHLALSRLLEEMTPIVALGVLIGDEPALLVLAEEEARILRVDAEGVETLYLGALVSGSLGLLDEQVDLARARVTLRYSHRRLPGDLAHVAETEAELAEQEQARAILRRWSTDQSR